METLGRALGKIVAANSNACNWIAKWFPGFFGYPSYRLELISRIEADLAKGLDSILEAGGIDRPLLLRSPTYRYHGLDIEEKAECHEIYDRFIVQSIEDPIPGNYGIIVSTTLLEHVPDNCASVQSMFDALERGGGTHHYVPSKRHPYALILRLVGPIWQKRLIGALRQSDAAKNTGYPTFFDRCSVSEMRTLFQQVGFEAIDIRAFYRGNDYFAFFLPAFILVTAFENFCRSTGWAYFASGFVISARRPAE